MQNCQSNAIWAQSVEFMADGLTVTDKVSLGAVEGHLSNFDGADLVVNNLDEFEMNNLNITSLSGADNREIIIDEASIGGAPAVDLDNTAGTLSNLDIDCGGSGTAITAHHGRASASLEVSDSTITSCTKGVDLHTDGESAPMILMNVHIESMIAISSDGADIMVHGGVLNGTVDVDSAIANLYDVSPTSESTSFGEIRTWATHIFDIRLNGNSQSADITFEVEDYWSGDAQGSSVQVSLPAKVVDDSGTSDYSTVRVIASANGLPDTDANFSFGIGVDEIIQVDMIENQAPEVEIIIPDDGFRIMEACRLRLER